MSSRKERNEPRKDKKQRKQNEVAEATETQVLTNNTQKGGSNKIKWPPFIIKSGYNGGDSVNLKPMEFFTTQKEFKKFTIIVAEFNLGTIKKGDRLRFIYEESNFILIVYVGEIEIKKTKVEFASADKNKYVAISLVDKDGKRFKYRDLIKFYNNILKGEFRSKH